MRGGFSRALGATLIAGASPAWAGSFDLFGIDTQYQLQATYAVGIRTEKPNDGIINTPPAESIPIPTYLKFPESANYDDGDRNFRRWSLVNNRVSMLGELLFQKDDYGVLVRGDAFYDNVYRRSNDNNSPDTINKYEQPNTAFTDAASYYDGMRARVLDAYAFGTWNIGSTVLNVRIGRQVVAWGESLFFDGVALSQGPADATKATVPGADVKSILLPVNQISLQYSLTDSLTLLGQYKLQYEPVELNPVGEFFSVADVVGPGREFIWGIKNPLYLPTYSAVDLTGSTQPNGENDLAAAGRLVVDLLKQNGTLPPNEPLTPALLSALDTLTQQLNNIGLNVSVPAQVLALGVLPNTPKYVNPQYAGEIRPSRYGQYGVGLRYAITPGTTLGGYFLRYHDTVPSLVQNYGDAVLLPSPAPGVPDITTGTLGIKVPVTYNVKYFDGVKLGALSMSTTLFGANIGAEAIYRHGIPVLVNAYEGILGPVPTPVRSNVGQLDLTALYVVGPSPFWDSLTFVGDIGANRIFSWDSVQGVNDPSQFYHSLKYDRDAWAYYLLTFIDYKNIFNGWDLQIPVSFAGVGAGHSSLLSGFGSLMGEGDYRASIAFNFTWLQQLTLGIGYNAFIGRPDFTDRPYQDRDYAAVTATYRF
ncbi:MAG TPA: DUF1302 family protein [Nevskiaceae bacterium]|nr:DUF1302 family protein [Nevskiaceae bacterium]